MLLVQSFQTMLILVFEQWKFFSGSICIEHGNRWIAERVGKTFHSASANSISKKLQRKLIAPCKAKQKQQSRSIEDEKQLQIDFEKQGLPASLPSHAGGFTPDDSCSNLSRFHLFHAFLNFCACSLLMLLACQRLTLASTHEINHRSILKRETHEVENQDFVLITRIKTVASNVFSSFHSLVRPCFELCLTRRRAKSSTSCTRKGFGREESKQKGKGLH